MKEYSVESTTPGRRSAIKMVALEAAVVAVIGALFAFAANEVSPRGLMLNRNYFPAGNGRLMTRVSPGARSPDAAVTPTAAPTPEQLLAAQLQERGLQGASSDRVLELFHDPRFKRNLVVFIDARDEQHYQEGHIPGAYEFDPYRPEKYFTAVLPVCSAAEQIVVYCNGGDCDDSETAAILLRDVGIANQKLLVYGGGIVEWNAHGLPVELGGRNSGNLRHSSK